MELVIILILGLPNNGFTASTDDISNLSAGTYSLSVVDENDCPITLDVEITEPDPIEIVFTASNENGFGVLCNGDLNGSIDVTVTGGTGVYTYSWTADNGFTASTDDISNLSAGTYTLVVWDENYNDNQDCTDSVTVEITEAEPVLVEITEVSDYSGFGVLCKDGDNGFISVNVTGGTEVYTYSWTADNGFTTSEEDISNLSARNLYT